MNTLLRIWRSRALAYVLVGIIGLTALMAHQDQLPVGISWNRTASLPVGLYWHERPQATPNYQDLVCTQYKAPEWARSRHYFVEGTWLCKKMLGLPGDRIQKTGNRIEVCHATGCQDVGALVSGDSRGQPVPAAALPEVIPAGYAYLGVPEAKMSFDSRYLGLIPINDIKRRIHPLWVSETRVP